MNSPKIRPVYLDLPQLRFPVTAITSILHRASGVLLFFALAPALWLLQASLSGPEGYRETLALLERTPMKVAALGLLWMALHHLFAGLRFLLLDLHRGVAIRPARFSARVVNAAAVALTLLIGGAWLV